LFEAIFRFKVNSIALAFAVLVSFVFSAIANPQLLVDMETGEVLFERDAGQPWYPASLTKLTTALVVFNAIENGTVTLETPVGISALAARSPGGKSGIAQGRAVKMGDALNLLIVKSANDIAIAIAQTVSGSVENFVAEMNRTAQNLGMSATRFANPHGLSNVNQVTSARDLAILALAIRGKFPQYSALFATSVVEVNGNALETNNNLLTDFAGTNGMKTGYICAAGMNIVASVDRSGRKLLAVVLGASSERERGELVGQMIVQYLGTDGRGTGKSVTRIINNTGLTPVNMRPRLCGEQSASYLGERASAFPFGLSGNPSFLTDQISPRSYRVNVMARLPVIPRPRPRLVRAVVNSVVQVVAPQTIIAAAVTIIPVPRSRIHR